MDTNKQRKRAPKPAADAVEPRKRAPGGGRKPGPTPPRVNLVIRIKPDAVQWLKTLDQPARVALKDAAREVIEQAYDRAKQGTEGP